MNEHPAVKSVGGPPLTTDPSPKKAFSFEPTITLGNVVSGVGMIVAVLLWGARLEGRVNAEIVLREEQQRNTDRRFDSIESDWQKQILQVQRDADKSDQTRRSEMRDIKDALSRIELKIDTKADKK